MTYEKPFPSFDALSAVHVPGNDTGQETRQTTSQGNRGVDDGIAGCELMGAVPRREVESTTSRKSRLDRAEDEAAAHDISPVPRCGHGAHCDAPENSEGGQVDGWLDSDQDHVGGDLEDGVGDKEDEHDDGVLIGRDVEVVLHASSLCVSRTVRLAVFL